MSENERLSAKQQRAIEALLTEPTTRAAAEAAKVSEATIFRWLSYPVFSAAYRAARERLLESTLTALQAASADAVTCLREVINDQTAQVSARVSAAKAVLDLSLKARDTLDVEERLKTVEEYLQSQKVRAAA